MPNVNEMRFALGQFAYKLDSNFTITRVKIQQWIAAQRGKTPTYVVKVEGEEDTVCDNNLFHSREGAKAHAKEVCCSRIAYYQHQINLWQGTLRECVESQPDSEEETDESLE